MMVAQGSRMAVEGVGRPIPQLDNKRSARARNARDVVALLRDEDAAVAAPERHMHHRYALVGARRHQQLAARHACLWRREQRRQREQRALVAVLWISDRSAA
jgi:hypothetical protein